MLALSPSGGLLAAPPRGPLAGRLHVEIARVAMAGLLLSSLTALWMTASTFDLLPDGGMPPAFPSAVSHETVMASADIAPLIATEADQMRALNFPYPGDATDVFPLKTNLGEGYIDQGPGALLAWADLSAWQSVSETIYMLHTGQSAATLGLALALMALGVPVMWVTGVLIGLAGRAARPRIRGNAPAATAQTIVPVGSEGGATWGFAATLHAALTEAGQTVHTTSLSAFAPRHHAGARRIQVLAASYGMATRRPRPRGSWTRWRRKRRSATSRSRCWALATAAFRPIAPSPPRYRRRRPQKAGPR